MNQIAPVSLRFDLAIEGMSCASCVARVEKSLRRVPGVRNVSVNLATEAAYVEAEPGTPFEALADSVNRTGYKAVRRRAASGQSRRESLELGASAVLALPLLLGMLMPLPGWLEFLLATPVQFWLGARFYIGAWKALRAGAGNMDLLVALGTSAAYLLSAADWLRGAGPLYFEASAVVIALVRLGKFLESRAKRQAVEAIGALDALRPAMAHRDGADIPLAQVSPGDLLEIRAGERVPADGVILSGGGLLDESHVTGESLPVRRTEGEKILAGALNLQSVLLVQVTAAPGESFLARMARLIEAAQGSKPQIQRLVDKVSAVFVPVVVGIAMLTFAGWMLHGAAFGPALIDAVSVLVIACPCALGLATPAAILAGSGAAARHGILVRDADALQKGANIDLVVFDKTGTLTEGRPSLVAVQRSQGPEEAVLRRIAAALAAADNHPFSLALRLPGVAAAEHVRLLPGRGIEGSIGGARYILGSAALIEEAGGSPPALPAAASLSYLALADGQVLAAFGFADRLRPDARRGVERLRALGCELMLLSGDGPASVRAVAEALGITEIEAAATPERKLAVIREKRQAGLVVAMVGDGVNDAACLAAADLGIAIGNAADMAVEIADMSLLRPEVSMVADALQLSRRCRAILRQGLAWALVFNVVGIPLAAFGLLSPMIAGAAMAASSVFVLGNALRLAKWRAA